MSRKRDKAAPEPETPDLKAVAKEWAELKHLSGSGSGYFTLLLVNQVYNTQFHGKEPEPWIVELQRCGRGRRRALAGRPDPLVDRDVADPEQLGDHPLADVAQGVEQHRQRLHRRRLAAGRRGREVAAAGVAAVALAAVRHAVPDERSAPAALAAQPAHADPPRPGSPARK